MSLQFTPLDLNNEDELKALYKWDNDLDLVHLIRPNKNTSNIEKVQYELFKDQMKQSILGDTKIYMIRDTDTLVGNFSLMMNPAHLLNKDKNSSWLGLTIGERDYWGKGVAKQAMDFFEFKSKELGADRIELGVFEFNIRAIKFYEKLGYKKIGIIEKFTYWNEKWWSDIRMEKELL